MRACGKPAGQDPPKTKNSKILIPKIKVWEFGFLVLAQNQKTKVPKINALLRLSALANNPKNPNLKYLSHRYRKKQKSKNPRTSSCTFGIFGNQKSKNPKIQKSVPYKPKNQKSKIPSNMNGQKPKNQRFPVHNFEAIGGPGGPGRGPVGPWGQAQGGQVRLWRALRSSIYIYIY